MGGHANSDCDWVQKLGLEKRGALEVAHLPDAFLPLIALYIF